MVTREATDDDETEACEVDRLATADLRKIYRPTSIAHEKRSAILCSLQKLVAILEGHVVGVVQYRIVANQMDVLGLGVHPDFRRRGVARALIQHLERLGADSSCTSLSLGTVKETGNVAVFLRMGWVS